MKAPFIKTLLIDDSPLSDNDFWQQNLVNVIASIIFMIAGPLFMYYGFYLLTWPYTVKWGALAIAMGFLVLFFGFSLWQDRQVQILRRMYVRDASEIRQMPGNSGMN